MKITKFLFYIFIYPLVVLATSLLSAQSTANYNISVNTTWNATDHSSIASIGNLPNDPHWSALALVTHKNNNEFLQLGNIASQGVQSIAEFGSTTNFQSEVNTAISLLNADQYLQSGFSPRGAVSFASINNITVSETYPLVTFLSMIAPSPDWFIAVNSESLRSGNSGVNNGWKDSYSIDLFVYDAGTDDGTDYASANAESNPKVGVFMINNAPINGKKVATATFTLNATLSNSDFQSDSTTFKIIPNPATNGKISISNSRQTSIESIQIYSVLGQLVKSISFTTPSSKENIDITNFSKGIYLVQIQSPHSKLTIQKLVIK
jgi:hypothetical protein